MKQSPPAAVFFDKLAISFEFVIEEAPADITLRSRFHSRCQTICCCSTTDGEVMIKDLHHHEDDARIL